MKKFKKRLVSFLIICAMIASMSLTGERQAQAAQIEETMATTIVVDPTQESPFNNGVFQGWGTFCMVSVESC